MLLYIFKRHIRHKCDIVGLDKILSNLQNKLVHRTYCLEETETVIKTRLRNATDRQKCFNEDQQNTKSSTYSHYKI